MSYLSKDITGPSPPPFIKPEPEDHRIAPLATSGSWQSETDAKDAKTEPANVKAEVSDAARVFIERGLPVPSYISTHARSAASGSQSTALVKQTSDVVMQDLAESATVSSQPVQPLFTVYETAEDIPYTPESALQQGLGMVKTIKTNIKKIELGSKLRKDVWLRDIESLQNQGAPTTMVAVCGSTGAGKSSLLNAILDYNIVPTSGMRACTAVVTQIAYHDKNTIDADVSFLSETEWREELAVLLEDLVDEEGYLKRTTDLKSDAGVAWHKVHAVYPTISQERLVTMTVDQIIAKDPKIAKILGTTKNITAKDPKSFGHAISKYIDSKDQKRGDKKGDKDKKSKEKENSKQPSLHDILQGKDGSKKKDKDDVDGPALWPLIRQVQVRCNAKALSTGAILVDLPGVADANAARNNIAKDYMKKCDCIWILAPITRAVDDKTARDLLGDAFRMQLMSTSSPPLSDYSLLTKIAVDGNYDANSITFVATKCDDISCSEVVGALNLDDDPELEEIEDRIEKCNDETQEWKGKKADAEKLAKEIDKELKQLRAYKKEYQEHIKALESGEPFTPTLTGKTTKKGTPVRGKKRKSMGRGGGGSPKRRKADSDDDYSMDDSDSDDIESDHHSDSDNSDSDGSDDGSDKEESDNDGGNSDSDEEGADEEVTEESLKAKIAETEATLKEARGRLTEARKAKKDANDMLSNLKKKLGKAQKDKNGYCSLKRSEFSRDVLKEDFRTGLKDLDDAEAEKRDPDSFDPSVNIRNYDEIDLPVFTVSARDYVRLTNQVKGDGDPTCFSSVEHTGVPELQKWCQTLTVSSRERAARSFLNHLKTFANSVRTYVEGIGEVTETDREALREKWESTPQDDDDDAQIGGPGWASSDDFDIPGFGAMNQPERAAPKVDAYGEPIGVTPRLVKEFGLVVDNTVQELQTRFRDGLEEKCQDGAANAAKMALSTSDAFAAAMHWATYRATLRRHGTFRQDLNVELINPMTKNIASSWSKVFEADLFASFNADANRSINKLLKEVEESAAPGLKDRVKNQGEVCLEEAKLALKKTVEIVNETMSSEQKEVSRCLAPHIQDQLLEGYDRALEERGRGSVARQKAVFHDFIENVKDEVFTGGADVIMERLNKAAAAVGEALDASLQALAEKIEVSLAILWEGPRDDPSQVQARYQMVKTVTQIVDQLQLWTQAEQSRKLLSAD
ncbi:hypothetical protein JAAARDRAFT_188367 [Jaapia argillacea MUCL 33604]|uniref:G domain-containing protein n=1 Tax=Jaapia argillacea MUCL 33604 TaxID=933084 RepID=A0A067QFZ2_9AGAM|nr:hypothetical protein JAAARDRAFT_188367 [Jaapia argillacea MUCL 33604]